MQEMGFVPRGQSKLIAVVSITYKDGVFELSRKRIMEL
jgi:hypothetical protein